MIEEVFIIHNAGVPLLSWQYRGKIIDQELVSGFLSALQMFAGRTRGQKIQVVTMEPSLMVFEQTPLFTVVVNAANRAGLSLSKKLIQVLIPKFQTQFARELENFSGNVEPFKAFSKELLSIITGCGIPRITAYMSKAQVKPLKLEQQASTLTLFDRDNRNILLRHGGNPALRDQVQFLFSNALKTSDNLVRQLCHQELTNIVLLSDNESQTTINRKAYVDIAIGKDTATWLNLSLLKNITKALKAGNDINSRMPTETRKLILTPSAIKRAHDVIYKIKDPLPIYPLGLIASTGAIEEFNSFDRSNSNWSQSAVLLMRCWKTFKLISKQIHRAEMICVELTTKNHRYALFSWGALALFGKLEENETPFEESTKSLARTITNKLDRSI